MVSPSKKIGLAALTIAGIALASQASAQQGAWQVRGRLLSVTPDESATLSVAGAPMAGNVSIENSVVPEVDISRFITNNVSIELILGVTPHDVTATHVGAVGGADVNLGRVWLLPPTITAQYHFDNGGRFVPYVGAGVNYTLFYGSKPGPVADRVDYGSSFGPALQAGVDIFGSERRDGWFMNVDVKRIWINSSVTADFTTALHAKVDADTDINPWVIGVGFGHRF